MAKMIDRDEIKATVAELPEEPGPRLLEYIEERLKDKNSLVYKVDQIFMPLEDRFEKGIRAFCTCCEQESVMDYAEIVEGCHSGGYGKAVGFQHPDGNIYKSYSKVDCPRCGSRVEAIHVSKFKEVHKIDAAFVASMYNVRGHLAVLSWLVEKYARKDGTTFLKPRRSEGILIINGRAVRVNGYDRNYGHLRWLTYWHLRENYSAEFGKWQSSEFVYDERVIYTTEADKSALHQYIQQGGKNLQPGAYLQMWCKCHQIENLVTSGNVDYVVEMINEMTENVGYSWYGYYTKFKISRLKDFIDLKKAKPHEMMRCEKADIPRWKKMGIKRFTFRGYIHSLYGIYLDDEWLTRCENAGFDDWYSVLQKHKGFLPPLMKTLNYLVRERKKVFLEKLAKKKLSKKKLADELEEALNNYHRYGDMGCIITPQYLYDYWRMLYNVYDGFPEELKYPKDLVSAHDEMSKRYKEKEDERLKAKFAKRAEQLALLTYTDEALGLFIRPCESQSELVNEGKELQHCVASYAQAHSRGETTILFIRRITEPNKPFFTLEYKNGVVNQNQGYQHRDRTPEVKLFEEKWLKYIKTIKAKDEKKWKTQ